MMERVRLTQNECDVLSHRDKVGQRYIEGV